MTQLKSVPPRGIAPGDFAAAMARLPVPPARPFIAVGVSGGGDSMALCLLLHDWACAHGGRVLALTVDHGLREAAAAEARKVHGILSARGIAHKTLRWEGEKPETRIQEKARAARRALLAAACAEEGYAILALAHNAEDQMETFWMRLAHGSGVDGLAGMAPASFIPSPASGRGRGPAEGREGEGFSMPQKQPEFPLQLPEALTLPTPCGAAPPPLPQAGEGEVTLIRPVLAFTRAELRDTCRALGVEWLEDPSNENEKFLRVRLRGFEDVLAAEGLTPARLAATAQKCADAREALEHYTALCLRDCTRAEGTGWALDLEKWRAAPRDIRRRVLAALLQQVNPQPYPPRSAALERLHAALLEDVFPGCTLAGCVLTPRRGVVVISREDGG